MTISVFKLTTGEEIICDADEVDDTVTSFIVSDAAQIIIQATDGRMSIGLAPYCPYARGKKIEIMTSAVVAKMEVEAELENEYRRIFGSGIVVANSSKIAL